MSRWTSDALQSIGAALTRDRLAHIDQHYLRPENYAAANAVLINAQAAIPLARLWGGGLVAAVDGMRFVVPVRDLMAGVRTVLAVLDLGDPDGCDFLPVAGRDVDGDGRAELAIAGCGAEVWMFRGADRLPAVRVSRLGRRHRR